jgi:2-aminoethylphosphonate dioxygenase
MSTLDPERTASFESHGYVLLAQQASPAHGAELVHWVEELASWQETPGKWMKWYEGSGASRQLCRVEDFVPYHQGLRDFLQGPALGAVLQALLGEPAALFKEKINYKLPGGAGFAPHQDAPAFSSFGQRYHVTVMIAVDPATVQNGCLEVVDGFHGAGLLPQAPDGTLHPAWSAAQRWKPIEMAAGDVLIFDSFVPHRSGPNHSDRPRRALYVTYNRAHEGSLRREYFQHKRAHFPPECERVAGADYSAAARTYNLGNPIS